MLTLRCVSSMRRGLTLVEVAITLAVVAVLLTLSIPALVRAREDARRSNCKGKLKQLGVALENYHALHRNYPAGWIGAENGQPEVLGTNGLGWGTALLPFFEEQAVYNQINFDRHFSSTAHDVFRNSLSQRQLTWLQCPDDQRSSTWTTSSQGRTLMIPGTSFVPVFGTSSPSRCLSKPNEKCRGDGLFGHDMFRSNRDLRDGASNTIILGERRPPALTETWYSTWAGIIPDDRQTLSRLLGSGEHAPWETGTTVDDFNGFHPGGINFLVADGRVFTASEKIHPATYRAIMTHSGGETSCCGF